MREGEYLIGVDTIPGNAVKFRTSLGNEIVMCGEDFDSGTSGVVSVEADPGRSITFMNFDNSGHPHIKQSVLLSDLVNDIIEEKEHDLSLIRHK